MTIQKNATVKDIVSLNFQAADVFTRFGIDFCCGGGISLEDASRQAGMDVDELIMILEQAITKPDPESDLLNRLSLDALCKYIIDTHHSFVRSNLKPIHEYLARIVMAHGDSHPELETVQQLFRESADDLTAHLQKEETVLFPYITEIIKTSISADKPARLSENSLGEMIESMEIDHQAEGDRFRKIAALTNNYVLPQGACNTYKVALEKLRAFEQDLHRHIHLENNILFPKALRLESELMAK